jgi:hypothetical protein
MKQNEQVPRAVGLFKLTQSRLVATPGALAKLETVGIPAMFYLARHFAGDWGDLDKHDQAVNEFALSSGDRLLSSYWLPDETKLWIITEAADEKGRRCQTTVLLPEEY